jgi:hypothetical protein
LKAFYFISDDNGVSRDVISAWLHENIGEMDKEWHWLWQYGGRRTPAVGVEIANPDDAIAFALRFVGYHHNNYDYALIND